MTDRQKKYLIIGGILVVLFLLAFVNLNYLSVSKAKNRDMLRVSNMVALQAGLQSLYLNTGSFELSEECVAGKFMGEQSCYEGLQGYISVPEVTVDPIFTEICDIDNCTNNGCNYTVGKNFSDKEYQIYFHLEKGYENLGPGCHYVDQTGIY